MKRFVATFCIALTMLFAVYSVEAAVYTVSKIADTSDGTCDADCSLREAVAAANATVDNDTIVFALPFFSSPQTITLGGTEIVIANNGSLAILGPGANRLTVSGNNASRILATSASSVGTIAGIRFTAGNGAGAANTGRGGAFYNNGGTFTLIGVVMANNAGMLGGAANHSGAATTTYIGCAIFGNTAASVGGAMQNFSTSTLNIINTTINTNTATSSTTGGGAIQANGMLNIVNSTFSGNSMTTTGSGGAIYYNGTGLTMTNTTIVNNTSPAGAGGFHKSIATNNANIRNSIFAGNSTADVSNIINSLGNNIIGVIGTSSGWLGSDQQNTNPLLAPLGFYGGLGMTHFPLSGSPAINMGQNCVVDLTCAASNPIVAIATDQRGVARPFGANVDVGAVEASGDYYAVVPSAAAGVPYNFTLVPVNGGFTYLLNSGSFGGIALMSGPTATTLTGTAPTAGVFSGLVQIVGGPGQAFHNYRINVLADPNVLSLSGRVLTSSGEPVSRAYVALTGLNGQTYNALTNGFGYFRMDGLPAGLNGTITVSGKKALTFNPLQITVSDVIDNLELRAQP